MRARPSLSFVALVAGAAAAGCGSPTEPPVAGERPAFGIASVATTTRDAVLA